MITRWAAGVLVAMLLTAVPSVALAQNADLTIDDVNDAGYPEVEVTVTTPAGLDGRQISQQAFTITENGRSVQPSFGDSPDAARELPPPPRVVLAIDVSKSMIDSIDEAKEAAIAFVGALPTGSQVGLVTFGDEARTLSDPTSSHAAVQTRIGDIIANGGTTALNAGVRQAANLLTGDEPGHVVVLSDGKNTADGTADDAIRALEQRGVQLWAVALPDDKGDADNDDLSALTGNPDRVLSANDAGELAAIYADVASNLARTYVLRYDSEADGRTELGVELAAGSLRTQQTIETTIDAGGAAPQPDLEPLAETDVGPVVVTVPLLGTVGAYVTGVTAFAAGVLILLLMALTPRRPQTRERLTIGQQQHRQSARLTVIGQWATDVTDRQLRRGSIGERLDRDLERAGVNLRSGELVVVVLSMMIVAYAIGAVAAGPVVGLALVPLPPLLVRLWLGVRRDRRQAAFSDQLTDVLQLVGSSLRAGYGLTQGIDAVSRDTEEPAASEFRRIIIEHRLGRDLAEAMDNCATRMDNADFSWVVQAISIHRDVGGDLSKVLDNIVATIRDRADVHRQVRTLSAEGRMSARVLTALPILVLVGLMLLSPDYMSPLWNDPIGILLLALGALLMITGMFVVRRMSKIQY